MTVDGGGTPRAPRRPARGRDEVVRMISGLSSGSEDLDIQYQQVNNDPAAVLFRGDSAFAVMVLDLAPDGEHIERVYTVVNPDKLSGLDR